MEKEIDIRSVIVTGLRSEELPNIKLRSLVEGNINNRQFNNVYTWSRKKATYFIESLILACEIHPFIMFKSFNGMVICDGFNRYMAIKKFVNNEFKLDSNGLTKLRWLKGKKYKDLTEEQQKYFLDHLYVNYIVYRYEHKKEPMRTITFEEQLSIQKQLYVRYNSGIKLAVEELQKAQFEGEYLTEKFRKALEDEEYRNNLRELYIGGKSSFKNLIDKMLVDIRMMIASTYSNINAFCYCNDNLQRINIFYEKRLCDKSDIEKDLMFENFNVCITLLLEMIKKEEWQNYEELHNKYFVQSLYWGISILQTRGDFSLSKIDLRNLLVYFGKLEERYKRFLSNGAHRNKRMIDRYFEIATYFKEYYGKDFTDEFEKENVLNDEEELNINLSFHDVRYHSKPITVTVETLLDDLSKFNYNLRPSYQRNEVINIDASSRVIESMIAGIKIPPILTFKNKSDNKIVFEVVDGQQRLLSILGYVGRKYKDINGDLCSSEKENFSLKGANIYYDINGRNFSDANIKSNKDGKILKPYMQKDILETQLSIVQMDGENNVEARDHFVRLNSNITPLKHNYLYWNAIADPIILETIASITSKNYEAVLGKNNKVYYQEQNIMALSYLFYQYNKHPESFTTLNLPLSTITSWLDSFNNYKLKCMREVEAEKILPKRLEYLRAINTPEKFLIKIQLWLEFSKCTIREIFCIKETSKISLKNLLYLFHLLNNISLEDLKNHNIEIKNILIDFFRKSHEDDVDSKVIRQYLSVAKDKIDIFNSNIENESFEKINQML